MFREYRAWDVGFEGYQMFDLVLRGLCELDGSQTALFFGA